MQCVVLAGGLGTRLRSFSREMPKTLMPVAGRPFADHQLSWLAGQGVTDVVYCIAHLGDQVRAYVGDGRRWGLRVRYADDGERLRGTGGALRGAFDAGLLAPAFGVLYGDSYLRFSVAQAWEAFERSRPAALMTVLRNEGRWDRSNARLLDDGRVVYDKAETDPAGAGMRHIDYGYSIIDRDAVLPLVPATAAVVDLAEVYKELSDAGTLRGFEVTERFYEIGSPESLAELERALEREGARAP